MADRRADPVWGTAPIASRVLSVLTLPLVLTVAGAHRSFAGYTDEITEVEGELVDVRWVAGNRLEVTTTGIDWPYFDDSLGTPQSDRIETFETFTLGDDQQRLDYEMIVTDPDTFTEPATAMETHWLAIRESLAEPTHCAE